MAYAPVNPSSWSAYNITDNLEVKEYAIGGKLITAKATLTDLMEPDADRIKQDLMMQIAQFVIENKLAEFTKIPDIYTGGTIYIARCYLAPNEQVKILRSLK